MAKKNGLKQVPMKIHKYYDKDKGEWINTEYYTHHDYDGDRVYESYADETGGLRYRIIDPVYIDNIPFTTTLRYGGYYRGRSAAGMVFEDSRGVPYTVFMSEFEKMIPHLCRGEITGKFWYVKRGRNFGIGLVEE